MPSSRDIGITTQPGDIPPWPGALSPRMATYRLWRSQCRRALTGWVPDRVWLALKFLRRFHRWPDYASPVDFNEWTHHYMLTCRDEQLTVVADKFAMRDFISSRLGAEVLVPLLGTWSHEDAIPLPVLPRPFVLKDSLGSGRCVFVIRGQSLDESAVRATVAYWRKVPFWASTREWAYSQGPFRVIAEVVLDGGSGRPPPDYKIYCFGGRAEFIQVDRDRFGGHTRNLYSTAWELLPVRMTVPHHPADPRPDLLDRMIDVAERLSERFVFLRVDCYLVDDRLYVGELTNYSGAGFEPFEPPSFARHLGECWQRANVRFGASGPS